MATTTFAVMGSGRRGNVFLRLAAAAPGRLRTTGVVTRTAERGREGTGRDVHVAREAWS